ncbi:MAG: hypothetical protein ACYCX7_02745 [Solirubrobacteraceae bacterium]
MSSSAPPVDDPDRRRRPSDPASRTGNLASRTGNPTSRVGDLAQQPSEEELVLHLERDQFVAETSLPVERAPLSPAASAGLWALRIFVVLVSIMVVYTFIAELQR